MEYPTNRFYNEQHMPLPAGSTSSISFTVNNYDEWCMSGCPDNVKWDGETPRFLNEQEKIAIILPQCDSIRNTITGDNVLNGFDWPPSGGVRFYLTQENQTNWTNLWLLSVQDLLTYPKTIWSGVETLQLANKQSVQDFYLAGVAHIELSLDQGLLAKQAFRAMTLTQLEQWLADNK